MSLLAALIGFRTTFPRIMKKTVMTPVLSLTAMIWTVKFPLQSVSAYSPTSSYSGGYCSSYSSCSDSGRTSILTTLSEKQQQTDLHRPNLPKDSTEDHPYSEGKLQERLTPLQYQVTQEAGTERAFTGKYYDHKESGIYTCIVCGTPLFSSDTKYDSGSGWPSFYASFRSRLSHDSSASDNNNSPSEEDHIVTMKDTSNGMTREEARCKKCGSHLGHVFDDGPQPTGRRFCINSAALDFKPLDDE